jgi:predicted CoA-binding protein
MPSLSETAKDFLSQKRFAVAGVSRSGGGAPANIVYLKLRDAGYQVFPINPKAQEVEGDRCYPDLRSIPGSVDVVVVATRPEVADSIVRECSDLHISRVWMHRSFGTGSVADSAVDYCRENNIRVIAGGCPMMFCEPVDFGHKCMRWILSFTGRLPKQP